MHTRLRSVIVLMSEYRNGLAMKLYGANQPSGHGNVTVGTSWSRSSSGEVGMAMPAKSVKWVHSHFST